MPMLLERERESWEPHPGKLTKSPNRTENTSCDKGNSVIFMTQFSKLIECPFSLVSISNSENHSTLLADVGKY